MLPHFHLIFSLILSAVLLILNFTVWQIAFFLFTAIFIDFDHYLYFLYKKKSWNLKEAYNYFCNLDKISQRKIILVFHNVEFLIIFFLLIFVSFKIFFPIFFGILTHYILDFIILTKEKEYKRAFSLIYYLVKNEQNKSNSNRENPEK